MQLTDYLQLLLLSSLICVLVCWFVLVEFVSLRHLDESVFMSLWLSPDESLAQHADWTRTGSTRTVSRTAVAAALVLLNWFVCYIQYAVDLHGIEITGSMESIVAESCGDGNKCCGTAVSMGKL